MEIIWIYYLGLGAVFWATRFIQELDYISDQFQETKTVFGGTEGTILFFLICLVTFFITVCVWPWSIIKYIFNIRK